MYRALVVSAVVVLGAAQNAQARPARAPQAQKVRAPPTSVGDSAAAFDEAARERVRAASVLLPARACTGVVVGSARVVATAAHCLVPGRRNTPVTFSDGTRTSATVAHIDVDRDVALLVTDAPASVAPLTLARSMPRSGAELLFLGRPDRARARTTSVTRLGPCPSLPKLPAAAFTTLSAVPGDSGAPLVDAAGRVVALVHGGARCHIAVPVLPLSAAFRKLPWDVRTAQPLVVDSPPPPSEAAEEPPADAPPTAEDVDGSAAGTHDGGPAKERFGPLVVERTEKGFRFSFSFSFGTKTKP